MVEKQIINCYECIFFDRFTNGENKTAGYCHSNSPIILPSLGHKTGQFPIVGEKNFCGDAVLIVSDEIRKDSTPLSALK